MLTVRITFFKSWIIVYTPVLFEHTVFTKFSAEIHKPFRVNTGLEIMTHGHVKTFGRMNCFYFYYWIVCC